MRPVADLLRQAPLIDGHNDLLWALREAREKGDVLDPAGPCPQLHTDLPRLEAGAVGGQFWSVFVPSDLPADQAVTQTLEQIDALFELIRRNPERLELAGTSDDVERIAAARMVASMLGVEGGHAIGNSLGTLRILASFGAGYLTLTHNDDTDWADSATGERTHGGLTRFGEEVVRELNRCGMLVDLSHTSEETMRAAIAVSEAPVLFSHSNARSLCDVPRNVPDDVLELAGRSGAVIQATFVPWFLTREGAVANAAGWEELRRLRQEFPDDREAVGKAMDAWFASQPAPPSSLADVADHIDHIRDVAGIEATGVGSDFDGVESVPDGLEDVSRYPALFEELRDRGYSDEDLGKVAGRNVLRVLREAERVGSRLRSERPPSTVTIEQLDG
ncbi:MAG: membrane dipeptidase [Actinobacteria bacterium]|nr:MAG: membrane dipeptidase [Actinomycetota bacterium]